MWTNSAYYYAPPLHLQTVIFGSGSPAAGSESAVAEQACAKPAVAEKTSSEPAVAESAPDGSVKGNLHMWFGKIIAGIQ